MSRLSSKDTVRLATLKLRGAGRAFYSAQPQLTAHDSTDNFETTSVNWFKDKHTDQYHYARLQDATHEKNEFRDGFRLSPKMLSMDDHDMWTEKHANRCLQ
jgi:hypothetical protein